ncbi:hypothetical protein [Brevibacillus centrosporus]|uniref:hypothetical protein n=1 Tax=Brevibacillus centrosporus TaxID=54910 RepID=UPI003D1F473B
MGATVSSVIGTLFFFVYPSPISLFVNVLLTIWMINRFKWNAPPIVAVSLIPFFSQSSHHWFIPLSVCAVMLGVMLVLLIAELVESKWSALSSFLVRNKVASDAEKLDIAG